MGLWDADRVAAAEEGPEFAGRLEQSRTRSAAAAAAAGRKRADLIAQASAIRIRVPQVPWDDLVRQACSHYNRLHADRGDYVRTASAADSPEFLQRITVNYLRHERTTYEAELDAVYRKVGTAAAEPVIRRRAYAAIAEAYPGLAAECEWQLALREGPRSGVNPREQPRKSIAPVGVAGPAEHPAHHVEDAEPGEGFAKDATRISPGSTL